MDLELEEPDRSVLAALDDGELHDAMDLAERLGLRWDVVDGALDRLCTAGLIDRVALWTRRAR